jgi:ribosome modulation factor
MNGDMAHDDETTGPRQSPASAADLLGPRETLATQEQGYAAALAGEHVRECPWKAAATDREVALRAMWVRGFAAGRTDLRSAGAPDQ